MSVELRLKKLRGSGGYIMAKVTDQQQMKGNLGGPDLFLAPIGRIDPKDITKHFCNTCEKEFDAAPKIDYENPNETVADNLVLVERGKYICKSCDSSIAEYREFKKTDQQQEVGLAKPVQTDSIEPQQQEPSPQADIEPPKPTVVESATRPQPSDDSVNSISGMAVFDENAKKIGTAKQVGVDSSQTVVLIITKDDDAKVTVPWSKVKTIGEIILLGDPDTASSTQNEAGKCASCGFSNKTDAKFCEECGNNLT